MAEERRSAPRARIAGVRVTYESATGDHVETDALNLGPGGLFVRSARPLTVGKRISLEIQVPGELVPWSALGRVVWTRERDEGERRAPGMGVKLIDVEDAVVTTIERLVAGREPEPELAPPAVPAREPLPAGVVTGFSAEVTPAPPLVQPTPVVPIAPSRERTILGVGTASSPVQPSVPRAAGRPHEPSAVRQPPVPEPSAPHQPPVPQEPNAPRTSSVPHKPAGAREPSVVIDLVAKDHDDSATLDDAAIRTADVAATLRGQRVAREAPRGASPYEAAHASDTQRPTKRRKRGAGPFWIVLLVVLAIAAAVGYVLADGDLAHVVRPSEPVAAPPKPPVTPPPASSPITATAPAVAIPPLIAPPTPAPTASGAGGSAGALGTAPSAAAPPAPKKTPIVVSPAARPPAGVAEPPSKKAAPADNPY
jgi:molecular chaperone DnaK